MPSIPFKHNRNMNKETVLEFLNDFKHLFDVLDIEALVPENVPEPYAGLLVHDNDMTSTLEKYFSDELKLQLLDKKIENQILTRSVLLIGEKSNVVTEYGAIHIFLDKFTEEAQAYILDSKVPLGAILRKFNISFVSQPQTFFRIKAVHEISGLLKVPEGSWLYGRQNVLLDPMDNKPLAQIIEILPNLQDEH